MKKEAYGLLIYALILLSGGIIGHLKANSTASLVAGVICALVMGASGLALLRGYLVGLMSGWPARQS